MSNDKTSIEKKSGFDKTFSIHTEKDYITSYKLHGEDKYVPVVEVIGISMSVTQELKKDGGSIVMAILDSIPKFHNDLVANKPMDILVKSISETGTGIQIEIRNVRFIQFGTEIGIADTSMEIQYRYEADSVSLSAVKS